MKKFKTVHENQVFIGLPKQQPTLTDILNNLENYILSLDRYDNYSGEDNSCFITENKEGEYIKLEDVLKLFGAEK